MEGILWISGLAASAVLVITIIMEVIRFVWWKPLKIQKHFESQGIGGPPYKLFLGNAKEMVKMAQQAASFQTIGFSHDILARVLPFYHQWRKSYGSTFLVWFGPTARLTIADPELIKEIFSLKHGDYEKVEPHPIVKKLEGDGLPNLEGEKWTQHRSIINPAFFKENLRAMIPVIAWSTTNMLNKWKSSIEAGVNEIDVCEQFENLSADIIARAAFGTSYEEGKCIFHMQSEQLIFAAEALSSFSVACFWRFLPTKKNLHQRKLTNEIRSSLIKLIEGREKDTGVKRPVSTDLLGLMIAKANTNAGDPANTSSCALRIGDIIEECKAFFFAGKQTTLHMLTWTVILLAFHQDWQQLARKQVLGVCGNNDPDRNTLDQLRILDMVVKETLRLYPPVVALVRRTKNEVNLGSLNLPQGMEILIPILAIHHDQTLWGDDVNEFNPGRFFTGAAGGAKHPLAFLPFGVGPRVCIGRNFSVMEAKVVLAMILQRFSFEISPSYRHAPTVPMMLYPQYGAHIILRPLPNST